MRLERYRCDVNNQTEQARNERKLVRRITALLRELKGQIGDEYRASDDPEDDKPGMQVTVATNDMQSWTYQTGDNSYSGGCYNYRHWGVISLYRRSNCKELAEYAVNEMAEGLASEAE